MKKDYTKTSGKRVRAIISSIQKKLKDNRHSEDSNISQRTNNAAKSTFAFHAIMHHEEI